MRAAPATLPVPALAHLRKRTYRLMGAAFLYPDERRLPRLVALARELRRDRSRAATLAFYPAWSRFVDGLADAGRDQELLRRAYVRTFLVDPASAPCLPQESAYGDGADGMGRLLGGLESEYGAEGLAMAGTGEPADHVAVELEFMAFLCGKEAATWDVDEREAGLILVREARFLEAHLARWLPAFADRLASAPDPGIYRALGEAAHSFVQHDRDLIELLAAAVPAAP